MPIETRPSPPRTQGLARRIIADSVRKWMNQAALDPREHMVVQAALCVNDAQMRLSEPEARQ